MHDATGTVTLWVALLLPLAGMHGRRCAERRGRGIASLSVSTAVRHEVVDGAARLGDRTGSFPPAARGSRSDGCGSTTSNAELLKIEIYDDLGSARLHGPRTWAMSGRSTSGVPAAVYVLDRGTSQREGIARDRRGRLDAKPRRGALCRGLWLRRAEPKHTAAAELPSVDGSFSRPSQLIPTCFAENRRSKSNPESSDARHTGWLPTGKAIGRY